MTRANSRRDPLRTSPILLGCSFHGELDSKAARRRFSLAFAGATRTSQNDEEPYARPSSEVAGPPFAFCAIGNGLWIFAWPTATMPGDSYSRIKLKTSGEHAESYFCSARGNRANECRGLCVFILDKPPRLLFYVHAYFTVCLRRSEVWKHHGRWDGRGDVCVKQEVGEAATTKR
ncbi:hypothetical protein V1478_014325 [Vespula squamosa]|uniref:Uncharacterized protein n=1 Tax=Vespula squamosa TaxID=30214 RepID=A0ABD2A7R1_VESSQ